MKKNLGFTLIELVIVISIILVIAAVTVPGILNYQSKQVEDQAVNSFINKFRNYQQLALSKESQIKVEIPAGGAKFSFCDGTKCDDNVLSLSVLSGSSTFYFNKYGDVVNLDNSYISNDIVINTTNYRVTINKYGGIKKEVK